MESKKLHFRLIFLLIPSIFAFPDTASEMSFDNLTFNFPNFETHTNDINLRGNASLMSPCIYLTSATLDQEAVFNIGWATYHVPMHLWDKKTGNVADFTTSFSFIIDSQNKNFTQFADGLTFFLAPEGSTILPCSFGLYLGLTCNWTESPNFSRTVFVAVEFDTFFNTNLDSLNDAHVGIDVSSAVSVKSIPWDWNRIKTGGQVEATVAYDSATQNLSVVWSDDSGQVGNPYSSLWYKVNLSAVLPEDVTLGFSASTGVASELHKICSWEFSSSLRITSSTRNGKGKTWKWYQFHWWIIVLAVLSCVFVVVLLFTFLHRIYYTRFCTDPGTDIRVQEAVKKDESPRKYSYGELKRATKNFDDSQLLSGGGFGKVYRAVLYGQSVAIKRLSPESRQGVTEFISEVEALASQSEHRNLVKLKGYCHKRNELLLVYEYLEKGSLDLHLFGAETSLSWQTRYKIAKDTAVALFCLHEKCSRCILHRDIKCGNILLDSRFTAKLGDFGLARLVDHGRRTHTTEPAGTPGYMAPEYASTGKASKESDLYSFGVVLLEIVSGRRANQPIGGHTGLVDWVWKLYGTDRVLEAADTRLGRDFDETEAVHLIILGLWCAHPQDSERPSIQGVINVLEGKALLPVLPREKPRLGKPPLVFNIASSTSTLPGSSQSNTGADYATAPSGLVMPPVICSDSSFSSATALISSVP